MCKEIAHPFLRFGDEENGPDGEFWNFRAGGERYPARNKKYGGGVQ